MLTSRLQWGNSICRPVIVPSGSAGLGVATHTHVHQPGLGAELQAVSGPRSLQQAERWARMGRASSETARRTRPCPCRASRRQALGLVGRQDPSFICLPVSCPHSPAGLARTRACPTPSVTRALPSVDRGQRPHDLIQPSLASPQLPGCQCPCVSPAWPSTGWKGGRVSVHPSPWAGPPGSPAPTAPGPPRILAGDQPGGQEECQRPSCRAGLLPGH